MSTNLIADAALEYAAKGWPVIPLHSPTKVGICSCIAGPECEHVGKHPRTQHGFKDGTTNEAQIREWWRRWPDANVGIVTGKPSGLAIVDIDPRSGGLESLLKIGKDLPHTRSARTGNNGSHYYYRTDRPVCCRTGILPGVDVKGDGGYIVAPPSRTTATYAWINEAAELAPAPDLLLAPQTNGNGHHRPVDIAAVLAGVPEGERDVTLFRAVCRLRQADVPREFAERLALEAASRCEPPFPAEKAREKVARVYQKYEAGSTSDIDPPVQSWPDPPADAAFYGPVGDYVRAIEEQTEADPIGIMAQGLVCFGNAVGGGAHFMVEGTPHHAKEFIAVVGTTSGGRKGTSFDRSRAVIARVDEFWSRERVLGGLSSGEGLIHAVRDRREERRPVTDKARRGEYEMVEVDAGIEDKRLLVYEPELARLLRVITREGSTTSTIIRDAWDRQRLSVLTKQALVASGTHISIVSHITREELLRQLQDTEAASGFGNRFLWLMVRRSRCLPDGGNFEDVEYDVARLARNLSAARAVGRMRREDSARRLWHQEYERLSTGRPGLLGAMLGRAEAHVLRLSMLYALADGSAVITEPHLRGALALWSYAERSARFIFGASLGDPAADELLRVLREAGSDGMTRTEISKHFGKNKSAAELARALGVLSALNLAYCVTESDGPGRPTERWYAGKKGEVRG